MDAYCYLIEHMIRDRIADARASARFAALRSQSNARSRHSNDSGRRLIALGRSLRKGARKMAFALSRAWPSGTHTAKRS